jgi:hypothetical protein
MKNLLLVGVIMCLCACTSSSRTAFNWDDTNYSIGKIAKASD